MSLQRKIAALLKTTDNPVRQRALFVAAISREMKARGAPAPIVVGGEALELYTQGSYTTGDIDLKARRGMLVSVLRELGFKKVGRIWVRDDWDIWIDWVGAALDEGAEAERRTVEVAVSGQDRGLTVRVISLEDLLVDRLSAAKYWKDTESARWVRVLLRMSRKQAISFDRDYFMMRLRAEGLMDAYRKISRRPGRN